MLKLLALCAVILALLVLGSPGRAYAEWTAEDTALEIVYTTLHVIDWGQTREIAENPNHYEEMNVILGKHPSKDSVDLYFASTLAGHWIVSRLLPEGKWRRLWQGVTIGIEAGCVERNIRLGIKMNW